MRGLKQKRARYRTTLMGLAWVCLVLGGSAWLVHYGSGPGSFAAAPPTWPADTSLHHIDNRTHLLLFLHPHCPCSRSTIRQLETALVHADPHTRIFAVVYAPQDRSMQWTQTKMVLDAGEIPGMQIVLDEDGRESKRFGAHTSGHIVIYDANRRLAFRGGITPGRGHEGSSKGLSSVIAILRGQSQREDRAEVFGCPIFAEIPDAPCANDLPKDRAGSGNDNCENCEPNDV